MAGDWIKMRGALLEHPKVIAMARRLHENKNFREWLTPGMPQSATTQITQIVSDGALRSVTCALLLRVWSASREHGKFDGDNLVLAHNKLSDLDQMCGVPGVGDAMFFVGWAMEIDGVTLPNFVQYNVPMSNAERQKQHRGKRRQSALRAVTKKSRDECDNRVTKEEKSRVDIDTHSVSKARGKFSPPTLEEVKAYCLSRSNRVDPQVFISHYESNGWRVGRNPMKDWRAAVHTWENNQNAFAKPAVGRPEQFSGLKAFAEKHGVQTSGAGDEQD